MDGNFIRGDVFKSRSRRQLNLKDVRTTRASIEFLPGEKPSLRSNFQSGLEHILISDKEGQLWYARSCAPGATVELEKKIPDLSKEKQLHKMFFDLRTEKKSYFMCKAPNEKQFYLKTHDGIDWEADEVIVGGELIITEPES